MKALALGLLAVVVAGAAVVGTAQRPASGERLFADTVAPLLKTRCLSCHNADRSRGGLDLSTRAALLEGGDNGPVVVPGSAGKSRLHALIAGPKPAMPRQAEPLGPAEVAAVARWIDAGAPWPADVVLGTKKAERGTWWAFRPLAKPEVPAVNDIAWPKGDIDRFVLATLEKNGLTPSAPADRETFIRRVTYDLHGLPPMPAEIADFVLDRRADAFERLVDRLLASPRYGERWARHWLDLVHYADTHGYDKDKRRLWAWRYRDWVVRALNRDLPFRRFLQYQVAGDALFPDDPDGIIAAGFVVAGPWDFVGQVELREGTVDKEKTRTLDRDDMVASTMATFNSLTVHCARCHDHKFDPIPTTDYYRLQAVFAGVERGDRPVRTRDVLAQQAELQRQRETVTARRDALRQQAAAVASPTLAKLDAALAEVGRDLAALPPTLPRQASPTNGYHSAIEPRPDMPKWVQLDLGQRRPLDTIRLIPARPTDFPDTPGFGFPARYRVAVSDDPTFATATVLADQTGADVPNPGDNPVSIAADGTMARYVRVTANKLWQRTGDYVFALGELQVLADGKNVARAANVAVTARDTIDAGRWHTRALVDGFDSRARLPDVADPNTARRRALEAKQTATAKERQAEADRLLAPALRHELATMTPRLASLDAQIVALQQSAQVYTVRPIPPRPIHVLARGDVERQGALASPGALALLPGLEHHFAAVQPNDEGSRRAALAGWLADDANPLTWRSIANRLWQYHFGKGLVDTPNDFGKNGSRPSHPALLDWLAADFRDGGDSFRRMHRQIVLSATYRQASAHRPDAAARDGDNHLLWRMNRTRLDAEQVRDTILAVSGKLDATMYGPGFELFRFKDDHSPIYDHLDPIRGNAPDTWRRTVYRFTVRSVPNPFLETLDCADPNLNVPIRNTTLTALQALALLNNPFVVRQAEFFAERLRRDQAEPERQIEAACRLAFGRMPTPADRTALTAYAHQHGLANTCRLLLNANEFLFVD